MAVHDMTERPDWCPEPNCCECLMHNSGGTCVGRLDKPRAHDNDHNTHNFCIYKSCESDPDVDPFRIEINKSDAWQFGLQLERVRSDEDI